MGMGVLAAQLSRLGGTLATSDHASVVSINLFVALLCACIVLGHLLEENRWLNESITALIIGLCTGVVILLTTKGKSSHVLVFSEDLFFIYLLPPIIFNAGICKDFHLPKVPLPANLSLEGPGSDWMLLLACLCLIGASGGLCLTGAASDGLVVNTVEEKM